VSKAIKAYRNIITTDEFKQAERWRQDCLNNEAAAINNVEKKWRAVVAEKDDEIAERDAALSEKDTEIAALKAQLQQKN
jgi:hypothetical protein